MLSQTKPDAPLVEFFELVSSPNPIHRADKSVGGIIPARALRYCEAVTSASAFGWYVFLPMNFKVVWDGHDMLWTYDGVDEWLPLTRDAVQYPHFKQGFDKHAPAEIQGFSPTFLTPSLQPGMLQIWTGYIARTLPDWSLLVRGVANLPQTLSYQVLEGIIETDTWFGPLVDNVRILKTDVPVEFRTDIPFLQVQPVRKETYSDKFLQSYEIRTMQDMSGEDWARYKQTVVAPNVDPERKRGRYAVAVRKNAPHSAVLT